MENIHSHGPGDDIHWKMNVSNQPVHLDVSPLNPHLSSLQINSNATSLLEPSCAMEQEIRVLLIDHDKDSLISTARILALNSCQVRLMVSGSIAMKTISAGKEQFDVVIIDIELSDMDSFQLCKEIEKMGILVVVTSQKEDPKLTHSAIENGASLFIKKPVDELSMKYLRQFVVKKRIQISKKKMGVEMTAMENLVFTEKTIEDVVRRKRTYRRKNGTNESGIDHPAQVSLMCDQQNLNVEHFPTKWTKELHQKFMDVVAQLGQGNWDPKEILELVNFPGLTCVQVANHLQKCRRDKWRPHSEHKNQCRRHKFSTPSTRDKKGNEKIKVFGRMPHLDHEYQEKVQNHHYFVPVSSSGNKPIEKSQTSGSRVGTLKIFNSLLACFPEKENDPQRWMEDVDLVEGESPMWTAQGVQLLNPTSHPWVLPPPTFNIVPSMVSNNNTTTTCYGPIHEANDDPTKETINANINLIP